MMNHTSFTAELVARMSKPSSPGMCGTCHAPLQHPSGQALKSPQRCLSCQPLDSVDAEEALEVLHQLERK